MIKMIEVTEYTNFDDTTHLKKVSVNPEYIAAIEEDGSRAVLYMSNNSVLHTVESRAEILALVRSATTATTMNNTYIK